MAIARAKAKKDSEEANQPAKILNLSILKPGDAVNFPRRGDSIAMHYIGFLEDGTCFDNSYNRGQSIYFILGAEQVIHAWEMILPVMSRGERAKIIVPPEFGYGERGYPPIIPPKATLTYELELIGFSSQGHAERVVREERSLRQQRLQQEEAQEQDYG